LGYELHITRADDWVDSPASPISEADWDAMTERHPDCFYPVSALSGDRPRQCRWRGLRGPVLSFERGQVTVKGVRDEAEVISLAALAADLGASLMGDDGEVY
jgi:hypothetical protein